MKIVNVKNMKVGEKYYFVDTDLHYHSVKMPIISKERINKIIGGEFSTKNEGDKYEKGECNICATKDGKQQALTDILSELKDNKCVV